MAPVRVWQVAARCWGLGSSPCESLHRADYVSSLCDVWLPFSWAVQMEQGRSSNVFCDQALEWLCSLWNSLLVTQDNSIWHRGDCTRAWIPGGEYHWGPSCRIPTTVDPVIPVKTNLCHPVARVTPGMVAGHGRSAETPSHPPLHPQSWLQMCEQYVSFCGFLFGSIIVHSHHHVPIQAC